MTITTTTTTIVAAATWPCTYTYCY